MDKDRAKYELAKRIAEGKADQVDTIMQFLIHVVPLGEFEELTTAVVAYKKAEGLVAAHKGGGE